MKFFVFAFALLVAGAVAYPQTNDVDFSATQERNLVTGSIKDFIGRLRETIQELGLDPLRIDSFHYVYNIPLIVTIQLFIENLTFTGASNIQINELEYDIFSNKYRFDFELPELSLVVGNAGISADTSDAFYNLSFRGSKSSRGIRVAGDVEVGGGILSPVYISDINVRLSVDSISSDLVLIVANYDLSSLLNGLFNDLVPRVLEQYQEEISRVLGEAIRAVYDRIWGDRFSL